MKIAHFRSWYERMLVLLLVAGGLVLFANPAKAEEYHGFVKNEWYLGKGGKPVGLNDFASNPRLYLRSEAAYKHLRHHVAGALQKESMSDAEFRALLMSNSVRLARCTGRINTAGITDGGQVGWKVRPCYPGEYLFEVLVPGGWMVVGSQGCYNPVMGKRPTLSPILPGKPTPQPVAPPTVTPQPEVRTAEPIPSKGDENCRWVYQQGVSSQTQVIEFQGKVLPSCLGPYFVPGTNVVIPGVTPTGVVRVCQ